MARAIDLFATKKFQHSLSWVLIAFTTTVCLLYSLLIALAVDYTEYHLINNYLEREHARISRLYQSITGPERAEAMKNLDIWLAGSGQLLGKDINVFSSDSVKLPLQFRNLTPDMHEFHEEDFFVLVKPIALNQQNIVLIYDETTISQIDDIFPWLGAFLTLVSLLIVFISLVVAYFVSRKIAFPITNLSQQLKADTPITPFKEEQRQDEIGELARSFSQMLKRLNGFLDREKQFTRHVSHELRTPAGVITNCLSVLKLPDISKEKRQRNLDRIEQSTQTINELIETFLILGREESKLTHGQPLQLHSMILACLNKIETKTLQPKLELDENVTVHANPRLVTILLDNLIKNACHYGKSNIQIKLKRDQLDIRNDLKESIETVHGYGYGQEIIQRIITELGWRQTIVHQNGQYRVTLVFCNHN